MICDPSGDQAGSESEQPVVGSLLGEPSDGIGKVQLVTRCSVPVCEFTMASQPPCAKTIRAPSGDQESREFHHDGKPGPLLPITKRASCFSPRPLLPITKTAGVFLPFLVGVCLR